MSQHERASRRTRGGSGHGADIVSLVATELQTRDITLALARVQPSVLELWTRAGAIDALGPGRLFGTVRGAVNAVTATSADTTS